MSPSKNFNVAFLKAQNQTTHSETIEKEMKYQSGLPTTHGLASKGRFVINEQPGGTGISATLGIFSFSTCFHVLGSTVALSPGFLGRGHLITQHWALTACVSYTYLENVECGYILFKTIKY